MGLGAITTEPNLDYIGLVAYALRELAGDVAKAERLSCRARRSISPSASPLLGLVTGELTEAAKGLSDARQRLDRAAGMIDEIVELRERQTASDD